VKCWNCERELERREHAQAVTYRFGRDEIKVWPKSLCDPCARANMWKPGAPGALDRLRSGKLDEDEVERIGEVVRGWARTTIP
jgi:hypothetical protein